jgi:hypothetical protein
MKHAKAIPLLTKSNLDPNDISKYRLVYLVSFAHKRIEHSASQKLHSICVKIFYVYLCTCLLSNLKLP